MKEEARIWHKKNRMPDNPSQEQGIKWAVEHAEKCGCCPIPESLLAEIRKRKLKIPETK
jgi:hypothetical protein